MTAVPIERALEDKLPILKPGDRVLWEYETRSFMPATLIGHGRYDCMGGRCDGLTVRASATRTTRVDVRYKRDGVYTVPDYSVGPHPETEPDPVMAEQYANGLGLWAFDLTCSYHGQEHYEPHDLCRWPLSDRVINQEVNDATAQRREISHGAARAIASWHAHQHEFTRTGVIALDDDPDTLWRQVSDTTAVLEPAVWRRAALDALRLYLQVHQAGRPAVALWPHKPVRELAADNRYGVVADTAAPVEKRWVAQFCGQPVGAAEHADDALRLALRHYQATTHPELVPMVNAYGLTFHWT